MYFYCFLGVVSLVGVIITLSLSIFYIEDSCVSRKKAAIAIILSFLSIASLVYSLASAAGYSPKANILWETNSAAKDINSFCNFIVDNPHNFIIFRDAERNKNSAITWMIFDKQTNDTHVIRLHDANYQSFLIWRKNGSLIFKNGYMDWDTNYGYFHEDIHVSYAMNEKIKDLLDTTKKYLETTQSLDKRINFQNSNSIRPQFKTLQLSAPVDCKIQGTISGPNLELIHQESL